MHTPFAVWVGPSEDRQSFSFSIRPVGSVRNDGTAVSPYIPLGFAEAVASWCRVRFSPGRGRRARASPRKMRRMTRRFIVSTFPGLGPTNGWRWPMGHQRTLTDYEADEADKVRDDTTSDLRPSSRLRPTSVEFIDTVCHALAGRRYTAREVTQALMESGIVIEDGLDAALQELVEHGALERHAGVGWCEDALRPWCCRRCGSTKIGFYPCYLCGLDACPQCDTCMSLGRVTACTPMYRREETGADRKPREGVSVNLPFRLTPHQEQLTRAIRRESSDALIWAACGAGKTEVTYEAIRQTVAQGGRVLFAVPRRDVVEQLGRRLQSVFSGADVVALYGGTPHRYTRVPIVVATVHQTLRFYRAFDLAVIDEVDAFPLNREPWLLDALERALIPGSRCIAMSATPSPAVLQQSSRADRTLHVLPSRPHGRPLPLPEFMLTPSMRHVHSSGSDQGKWLVPLGQRIEESVRKNRRVLVFVPSVNFCEVVKERLMKAFPHLKVASVHAGDTHRAAKVELMNSRALDVLVCTTVLERGVTWPRLDAVVFAADTEGVWDAASLIQMAGRVDRSPEDRGGRVTFLAARKTPAMEEARRTIAELNENAMALGLITDQHVGGIPRGGGRHGCVN